MNRVTRRLRSLLIALAVLALSATIVLAGRPAAPVAHPDVPAPSHDTGDPAEQATPEAPDESEAAESPDAPDPSEADAPDAAATEHPDNHGKLVSEAAQAETPDGFANHGAYVRTIARDNHGHADAATKQAPKPATPTH